MSTKIKIGLMLSPLSAVALYFALVYFRPPMPGDQPSPKLVEMFNREIDTQLARLGGPHFLGSLEPEYGPNAAYSARLWLSEVREVVTHCRHGGRGNAHNPHEYDLTLQSGAVFSDVTASILACLPRSDTPMRVTFEGGRVVQVTTDGSERESTLEVARTRVQGYVEALVRRDVKLRPERYYLEPPKESAQRRHGTAPERSPASGRGRASPSPLRSQILSLKDNPDVPNIANPQIQNLANWVAKNQKERFKQLNKHSGALDHEPQNATDFFTPNRTWVLGDDADTINIKSVELEIQGRTIRDIFIPANAATWGLCRSAEANDGFHFLAADPSDGYVFTLYYGEVSICSRSIPVAPSSWSPGSRMRRPASRQPTTRRPSRLIARPHAPGSGDVPLLLPGRIRVKLPTRCLGDRNSRVTPAT